MPYVIVGGLVGLFVLLVLALLIARARRAQEDEEGRLEGVLGAELELEDSPIVKLARRIVEDAYTRGASTIRIEPTTPRAGDDPEQVGARVQYRIDGELEERMALPIKALPAIVARFAVLAGLHPTERDRLQEGRIQLRPPASPLTLDLRVTCWRSADGPHCVLELLSMGTTALGLDAMELAPANLERLRGALGAPGGGVVLFAGVAGSGRRTTLYSARDELPGSIVHVAPDDHFPWVPGVDASNVRHLDADVVVTGELHDAASARLAFAAAQEGRLVLASIFADDVGTALARLRGDLAGSPHVLGLCLRAVVAQRLCRRLCRKCKPQPRPDCTLCSGKGYKGRVPLHEVALVEGPLQAAVRAGETSAAALQQAAIASGMTTMEADGQLKVAQGITDLSRAGARRVQGSPTAAS